MISPLVRERAGCCGQELYMQQSSPARTGRTGRTRADAETLYLAHVEAIYAYLARRLGSELANDLAAETFRVAIENLERFDTTRGSERAWLFGIAPNLMRRHWRTETRRLRAMSRHANVPATALDPLLGVTERIDATQESQRLLRAVANLAAEDRDLLVLVAWERCSHREVADALGIPMGTVRSRLHRIRTELRTGMDKHDDGEE